MKIILVTDEPITVETAIVVNDGDEDIARVLREAAKVSLTGLCVSIHHVETTDEALRYVQGIAHDAEQDA